MYLFKQLQFATTLVFGLTVSSTGLAQTDHTLLSQEQTSSSLIDDKDSLKNEEDTYLSEAEYLKYRAEQKRLSKLKVNRKFTHSFTFSAGQSNQSIHTNKLLRTYSDTSENTFTFNGQSPTVSLSHDIALDNRFSLGYTIGFQKTDIDMNGSSFSSKRLFAFVHPRLIVIRRNWFEAYFQLKVGLVYHDAQRDRIQNNRVRAWVPTNFKLYTGLTPFGAHFKLSDRIGLTTELSLFSFESVNVGLRYMFKANSHHIPAQQ